MNIPEEIVEKAAEAAWLEDMSYVREWAKASKIEKDAYRAVARAALSAAAPTLMAMAWDEGASFAEHSFPEGNNPYRKEQS